MASPVQTAVRLIMAGALLVGALCAMWFMMQTSTEPVSVVERPEPVSARSGPRVRPHVTPAPERPSPEPGVASREEIEAIIGDTDVLVNDELPAPFEDTALPEVDTPTHLHAGDLAMATGFHKRATRHFAEVAEAEGDSVLGRVALYRKTQAEWKMGDSESAIAGLRGLLTLGEEGGVPPKVMVSVESDLGRYLADSP